MIIDNDLKNIRSHKATGLDSFTVRILSYFERKKSGSGEGRSRRSIPPSVLLTAALAFSPKENDSLVCGNHLDNTDFPAENHRNIIKATFKSRSAFIQASRTTDFRQIGYR